MYLDKIQTFWVDHFTINVDQKFFLNCRSKAEMNIKLVSWIITFFMVSACVVVHWFTNAKSLGRYRLVKDWLRLPIMSKMWCVNIFYLFPILAFDIIPVQWEKEMQYKKINAFLESSSESLVMILQESYTSHSHHVWKWTNYYLLACNIFKFWTYKYSILISLILTQNKKG